MNVARCDTWKLVVHQQANVQFVQSSGLRKRCIAVTERMGRWQPTFVFFGLRDMSGCAIGWPDPRRALICNVIPASTLVEQVHEVAAERQPKGTLFAALGIGHEQQLPPFVKILPTRRYRRCSAHAGKQDELLQVAPDGIVMSFYLPPPVWQLIGEDRSRVRSVASYSCH